MVHHGLFGFTVSGDMVHQGLFEFTVSGDTVYLGSQSERIWSIMVGMAEYQDCTAPGILHDCREAEKHR